MDDPPPVPPLSAYGAGPSSRLNPKTTFRGIEPAGVFCRRWQPPAYIVDGVLPRGRVQALTAFTGHCKTTTAIYLAICVATGRPFGHYETEQGSVLILAGENPDLVSGQFSAACHALNVEPDDVPVFFHYGRFHVTQHLESLKREAGKIFNLNLIIADTHQAFFEGDNDNDNIQALAAAEKWRPLTALPTRPTVLIPCHPSGKKPERDNLVPRGGSAFMNEIDGNLSLWRKDDHVTLHWHGKHRGPSFEPLDLKLDLLKSPEITDSKGRLIAMPVIRPLMTTERIAAERQSIDTDLKVLQILRADPTTTVRALGEKIEKSKSRAQEIINKLKSEGLIYRHARKWKLTTAGNEVLKDAGI